MNWLFKEVPIPRPLHYLHGTSASLIELSLNYGLAVGAGLAFAYGTWDEPWSLVQKLLLLLLAIDLAGGVVSNFTAGTKRFYSRCARRRIHFIGLHVLQSLLMLWLFPQHALSIGLLALYTLAAAFCVNGMSNAPHQKVVAACLLTTGIIGTLFGNLPPVLNVLILLFQVKLILSFPVKW